MSSKAETVYQMGLETTAGTAVAATRKIYPVAEMPLEVDATEDVVQARDNYIANYDTLQNYRQAEWKTEEVLNFNEAAFYFELLMKGGVTATGAGPYVRVYDATATSDNLKSATLECSDNVAAWEVPYLLAKDFEIVGAEKKPIMLKASWVGQKKVSTTMTAALSDRDISGHYALFANTSLFLDDSAGGIGGTEVAAALMGFNIKCDLKPGLNFAGNGGGLYTSHTHDKRFWEVTLDLLLNATTLTEFNDHYADGEARFGRLRIDGAGNDVCDFNFHVKRWAKWEPKSSGPTRRITLMGRTAYNPTLGYDWRASLTNDVSAITS